MGAEKAPPEAALDAFSANGRKCEFKGGVAALELSALNYYFNKIIKRKSI